MDKGKLRYLLRSAVNYFAEVKCTNCGSTGAIEVDRKMIVTRLFRCENCSLQFRHPSDDSAFNKSFYQDDYVQEDGITTDLPDQQNLQKLIDSDFQGTAKNVQPIINLWSAIFSDLKTIRAVDYGASWGYMSYQFKKRGISIQSFEISKPRCKYGNTYLQLDIKSDCNELTDGNDLVYSSHVIEHVSSIPEMLTQSKRLLNAHGFFVAESPNGSGAFRNKDREGFHRGWGLVHPNYLSDQFYQGLFKDNPYFITSSPFPLDEIRRWDKQSQVVHNTEGGQLLVIARPNQNIR